MRPSRFLSSVAITMALVVAGLSLPIGAAPAALEFVIKTWMIEDGLPQNSVLSFCQTADGYIWLGTEMGLARFNGTAFRVFNRWNTPEIKENRITALAAAADGTLWIGSDGGGVCRFRNGSWKSYGREAGLPGLAIHAIGAGRDGRVFAATDAGLAIGAEGRWQTAGDIPAANVLACLQDRAGRYWVGCASGWWRQSVLNGESAAFTKIGPEAVQCLAADGRGKIWLGTAAGLRSVDMANGKVSDWERELSGLDIRCLWIDEGGDIWAGTHGLGLWHRGAGNWRRLGRAEGFTDEFIQFCARDRQGNLWTGSLAGGLSRLKPRVVTLIGRAGGLAGGPAQAVWADADGTLWIGGKQGLSRRSPTGAWTLYSRQQGLPGADVRALCRTRSGDLWAGTDAGLALLSRADPDRFVALADPHGGEINVILEDRRGVLWVGGSGGLRVLEAKSRSFDVIETLQGMNIRALVEESEGRLWIGTSRGLYAGAGEWIEPLLAGESVLSLSASRIKPGLIWVGIDGGGLATVFNGKVRRYSESDGLLSNKISALLETAGGDLWLGSSRGIFRLRAQALLAGKPVLNLFYLNDEDGVIRGECADSGQPAVTRSPSGSLEFATRLGVVSVEPERIKQDIKPPLAALDEVRLDNRSLATAGQHLLSPGQHLLEFYFSALDFTAPSKAQLSYRLDGFDGDWKHVEPGKRGAALYYNLKSGRYRFRVRTAGSDGRWSEEETLFPFRIRSSFPLLLLLIPLLVLAAAAAGLGAWRRQRHVPPEPEEPKKKYQTSTLTPDRAEEMMANLQDAMENEKLFLNPSLTLKKLSEKLLVHPNHLSRIINERFGQNFNDYINRQRIEEAKMLLLDPGRAKKSILDIAYEVGFYSKSVFNTAFKKFTGQTPSEFRERVQ